MTAATLITASAARNPARPAAGDDRPMTLAQTAAYLQLSRAHLSNVIKGRVAGVAPLRHAAVGRRILVRPSWADQWLEELAARAGER